MNAHLIKAVTAAEKVEHHRREMGRWAAIRAKNIRRARVDDGMTVAAIAEDLGVSESAVRKAITLADDPEEGRARWHGRRPEET